MRSPPGVSFQSLVAVAAVDRPRLHHHATDRAIVSGPRLYNTMRASQLGRTDPAAYAKMLKEATPYDLGGW